MVSTKKGFTLIELLVVISIIGVLSSVVLAGVTSAKAKARDTQRIQHMTQIKNMLYLYAANNGNTFPGETYASIPAWDSDQYSWNQFYVDAAHYYLKVMPYDPVNDATHWYGYFHSFSPG